MFSGPNGVLVFSCKVINQDVNVDNAGVRPVSWHYEDVGSVYYSREASTFWLIEQGKKFLKDLHTITDFPTGVAVAHRVSAEPLVSLAVMIEKVNPT